MHYSALFLFFISLYCPLRAMHHKPSIILSTDGTIITQYCIGPLTATETDDNKSKTYSATWEIEKGYNESYSPEVAEQIFKNLNANNMAKKSN
jgi:hypothetical protein